MHLDPAQFQNVVALGLFFFISLGLAVFLTPIAERLGKIWGIMDYPSPRKVHSAHVSRLGGAAMALALFLTLLIMSRLTPDLQAFLSGALIICAVGLVDDFTPLSPRIKFMGQILAVTIFISQGGSMLENLGNILGTGELVTGIFAPILTLLGMVGLVNAFNLSDGLDGLAAGLAGIACVFLIPFAYAQENWSYLLILCSLFGVILGFIRYNTYPARLFMGDAGSLFLGFVLAAAAVSLTQQETATREYMPVTALVILSLPVADTLYVMTRRILKGQNPAMGDRSHLHHRLLDLGISHELTVSLLYGHMFIMGVCALLMRPWPEWVQFFLLLIFYALLYFVLWLWESGRIIYNRQKNARVKKNAGYSFGKKLRTWSLRHAQGCFILVWLLFMLPALSVDETSTQAAYYILFILLFTVTFYPWTGGKYEMPLVHGLLFFNIFSIILIYSLTHKTSLWFIAVMAVMSLTAITWTCMRLGNIQRIRLLIPGSFEFLLLGVALVATVIVHYFLEVAIDFRRHLFFSVTIAIPVLFMTKVKIRRKPSSSKKLIVFILFVLLLMLLKFYRH